MPMMRVALGTPAKQRSSIGGYTRLILKFVPAAEPQGDTVPRNYHGQRRNPFKRYFAGKSIARIFSIKATLARPRVAAAATIASLGYDSNKRNGESFTTEFSAQRVLTPYFRIDADSAINLETSLVANSTYDSSVASDLLDVVKRAASLVAPTATLITSLNKDRFQDASQFVDQSIASLMKESIVERSSNDFPMPIWTGGALATVDVWMPTGNEISPPEKPKPGHGLVRLGRWEISSSPAVLSIFSDTMLVSDSVAERIVRKQSKEVDDQSGCSTYRGEQQTACFAFRTLDPQTVMNFQVDAGLSVAQALAGDSGIAAAREKLLVSKVGDDTNQGARVLCTLIADKGQQLGFNRYDIAAVLWAYASQSFVTNAAGKALRDEMNCAPMTLAYGIGLPRGGFAAPSHDTPPPPPADLSVPASPPEVPPGA